MVLTPEGNVIIDTSLFLFAPAHEAALRAIDDGPVKYIILTHAHPDHTGGVDLWKEAGTEVIAHRNHESFVHYQQRLSGVFNHRNTWQFSLLLGLPPLGFAPPDAPVENYGGTVLATRTFDQFCEFRLGGLTFQIMYTPGETYDGLTVWVPEYKAAFVGDNFYELSFPNMYTLRGTRPRWALDYVESLETVVSWGPELLAPSHLDPVYGNAAIDDKLSKYRDAILYVHDETVQGINAGKSPETLMDEVTLPPEIDHGEGYGTVPWSVHGIYDGYVGFFDENPASMFSTAPRDAYPELATLAGGPDPIATRAGQLVTAGDYPLALRVADAALAVDPDHLAALQARLAALQALFAASVNTNEQGWLNSHILDTTDRIANATP
jgi:alkyl sulfatase BDS1-like metallo-beta-lactamase superfamily hydrolase